MSDAHEDKGHPAAGYVGLVVIWALFVWLFAALSGSDGRGEDPYTWLISAVICLPLLAFGIWAQWYLTKPSPYETAGPAGGAGH